MQNILLAIHLIIAALLIIAVLMQRSEGGGLGIGGGGNAKAAEGGLDNIQKFTWYLIAAFFATSLTLFIFSGGNTGSSVLDQLDNISASETAPAVDGETPAADADNLPVDPNASN